VVQDDKSRSMNRCESVIGAVVGFSAIVVGCGNGSDGDRLVGTWIPTSAPTAQLGRDFDWAKAPITFRENGRWTASDPCNHLFGHYRLDGSKLLRIA
jgi:hypothetical protein